MLSVESAGHYHLDDVNCAGDEMNLVECSHNGIGVHDCATGKHARVRCDGNLSDVILTLQLHKYAICSYFSPQHLSAGILRSDWLEEQQHMKDD